MLLSNPNQLFYNVNYVTIPSLLWDSSIRYMLGSLKKCIFCIDWVLIQHLYWVMTHYPKCPVAALSSSPFLLRTERRRMASTVPLAKCHGPAVSHVAISFCGHNALSTVYCLDNILTVKCNVLFSSLRPVNSLVSSFSMSCLLLCSSSRRLLRCTNQCVLVSDC